MLELNVRNWERTEPKSNVMKGWLDFGLLVYFISNCLVSFSIQLKWNLLVDLLVLCLSLSFVFLSLTMDERREGSVKRKETKRKRNNTTKSWVSWVSGWTEWKAQRKKRKKEACFLFISLPSFFSLLCFVSFHSSYIRY